jgi:formylglycine-generating enzyme required for sulfatase activity
MVPVGSFCIDRYEASVRQNPDCSGDRYGESSDDCPAGFPDNGNWTAQVYACSLSDVMPARYVTWFQAQRACAASGKRLCTNEEWQAAAAGTPDDATSCNISTTEPENTGARPDCVSRHRARDMVGNLWEWTALWVAEPGWNGSGSAWPSSSDTDAYWHGGQSTSPAHGTDGSYLAADDAGASRIPAVALRGGSCDRGTEAGVFAIWVRNGPSSWGDTVGFRCCRSR